MPRKICPLMGQFVYHWHRRWPRSALTQERCPPPHLSPLMQFASRVTCCIYLQMIVHHAYGSTGHFALPRGEDPDAGSAGNHRGSQGWEGSRSTGGCAAATMVWRHVKPFFSLPRPHRHTLLSYTLSCRIQ